MNRTRQKQSLREAWRAAQMQVLGLRNLRGTKRVHPYIDIALGTLCAAWLEMYPEEKDRPNQK